MRAASLRQAAWHRHLNAVNAPPALRAWLACKGSLTARLQAHSREFRVQRLRQQNGACLPDEAGAVGLPRRRRVRQREVLLKCEGQAVVFAHTIVPLAASLSDWPLFGALGERSLGSTLFGDPLVRRGALEFAKLRPGHPLVQRALAALDVVGSAPAQAWQGGQGGQAYYARRCLYRRGRGLLLVTELFLPEVLGLVRQPAPPLQQYFNHD
jgi:chorismate--pyruvate lyase